MSSLALMRWLEGAPERYDAGMRLITFGAISKLHAAVAESAVAKPGDRVLEIGCGTGMVTARLLSRGARVTAVDQAPEMLEQARQRVDAALADRVEWVERTASEIDGLGNGRFDAIVLSLCLSDMSASERAYVLRACAPLLVSSGTLVVADEVAAPRGPRRLIQRLWRLPQAILGWLLVGALSRPIPDLEDEIRRAGFAVRRERRFQLGNLALYEAEVAG